MASRLRFIQNGLALDGFGDAADLDGQHRGGAE